MQRTINRDKMKKKYIIGVVYEDKMTSYFLGNILYNSITLSKHWMGINDEKD